MYLAAIGLCMAIVIGLYFLNNPLRHSRWFLIRRFINWFPLGMTYAFLYMGRYNLTVSKTSLGSMMTKEQFGLIAAAGTCTYALSFLVNGPLVDRIGGKKGILIGAVGASFANIILGILTYLVVTHRLHGHMVAAFSAVYALNMYFQSYGAVSIIKIKAYWFHVRERGMFGAIFGSLISVGIYLAIDWGQGIAEMTKADIRPDAGWMHRLLHGIFALKSGGADATWAVFFVPAAALLFWAALDLWLIKDAPEDAGFPVFEAADASTGQMHINFTKTELLKKVFTSPLMLCFAAVELTSGLFRDGITNWYFIFSAETHQGAAFFQEHWGWLLCIFGIVGGFAGGLTSDKFFHSRRGPPTAILSGIVLVTAFVMSAFLFSSPIVAGWAGVAIVMCAVGITSLMSGTAAADFGGRKATATCMGIVDGFAYIGSGLQSVCLSYITTWDWRMWPLFLVPFALMGLIIAIKIWNALPAATRRYIAEVEEGREPEPVASVA